MKVALLGCLLLKYIHWFGILHHRHHKYCRKETDFYLVRGSREKAGEHFVRLNIIIDVVCNRQLYLNYDLSLSVTLDSVI